jgi:NAD(P)-dependent dehydrogenase (short-subunit alcohol dehydrogenase family)
MSDSIMVIGAGPGIGQAVAERFGRAGWSVVLAARDASRLRDLVSSLVEQGIDAHAVPVDATDPAALRIAMAEADRIAGGLGVVHFNAAIVRRQNLLAMTDDEVVGDLAINVAAGLHAIRAAVAQFGDRSGTILVTGGGLAIAPHPDYASLGLGKAALRNVVQALAPQLAERSIRIAIASVATLVAPGSPEARGVADTFFTLATDPEPRWEAVYPQVS